LTEHTESADLDRVRKIIGKRFDSGVGDYPPANFLFQKILRATRYSSIFCREIGGYDFLTQTES
jgi:hypothetical protein